MSKLPSLLWEYSDFQCPYCARAGTAMKGLIKKYDGKVNLVYKHFPLSFHPFAKPAAEYFEAIALIEHSEARKFHDAIFDNFSDYQSLKDEKQIARSLKALVRKMGLSMEKVKSNMKKAEEMVQKDMAEAKRLKIGGTPSFFINGINPKNNFDMVIGRLLKEKGLK